MKTYYFYFTILLIISSITSLLASPNLIHPITTASSIEKDSILLSNKTIKKKVKWGARLKGRLLAGILKNKIRKLRKKQSKANISIPNKHHARIAEDSISVEQIIALKNKQLADRIGLSNNIRTRAKLNMMRCNYKKLRKENPTILQNKVAISELETYILSGGLLEAEIAQYLSIGGFLSLIFGILVIPFLLFAVLLFIAHFCVLFTAITKGQKSDASWIAIILFLALVIRVIIFAENFEFM